MVRTPEAPALIIVCASTFGAYVCNEERKPFVKMVSPTARNMAPPRY